MRYKGNKMQDDTGCGNVKKKQDFILRSKWVMGSKERSRMN
jgi:hypothetical protein